MLYYSVQIYPYRKHKEHILSMHLPLYLSQKVLTSWLITM